MVLSFSKHDISTIRLSCSCLDIILFPLLAVYISVCAQWNSCANIFCHNYCIGILHIWFSTFSPAFCISLISGVWRDKSMNLPMLHYCTCLTMKWLISDWSICSSGQNTLGTRPSKNKKWEDHEKNPEKDRFEAVRWTRWHQYTCWSGSRGAAYCIEWLLNLLWSTELENLSIQINKLIELADNW